MEEDPLPSDIQLRMTPERAIPTRKRKMQYAVKLGEKAVQVPVTAICR